MVVNSREMKRSKRRVTADLHSFNEFPSSWSFNGPFRSNVLEFVDRSARPIPTPSSPLPLPSHLRQWRISFRLDGADPDVSVVDLDVAEEDVARSKSLYCDQCRVVGWSDHPVCTKRYHFIIRNETNRLPLMCMRCGSALEISDVRCANCFHCLSSEDMEDRFQHQFEDSSHLLHGVVHTNGYGHLLRINGREGGSKALTGSAIMDLWDRLCKMLRVRKVSVMDISKKYGLDYRVLHAVTAGRPWYGDWGYEFGAGSFALTEDAYLKAVEILSDFPVSRLFFHNHGPRTRLHDVIALYWSMADHELVTIRDLFCFLVMLIREARKTMLNMLSVKQAPEGVMCAWNAEDVRQVENAILKILRAAGVGKWVSWRSLRGATFRSVASSVLLDYCLKRLAGKVTDDRLVVASKCNADMNTIEYRLESLVNPDGCIHDTSPDLCRPTVEQLIRDLRFLYETLLNPDTMNGGYQPRHTRDALVESARKLLDCKQFVKNYEMGFLAPSNPSTLYISSEVVLTDQPQDYVMPAELVTLPATANLGDLKLAVARAFQETYLMFLKFQVEEILKLDHVDDSTNLKLLLGGKCSISVKGRCHGDHQGLGKFRKERGTENWTVECVCGARDDDGERMMACDRCGVWRHTRCMGINDLDDVPKKFICWKCAELRKTTSRQLSRMSSKRSRDDDTTTGGRIKRNMKETTPLHCSDGNMGVVTCNDDLSSTTSSMSDANQFGCLTSVG